VAGAESDLFLNSIDDMVEKAIFVLSDGETIVTERKISSGIDLTSLFVGSNANIGILGEVTLRA
jgi:FAD/FMN-containing dehydrogenase